MAVRVWRRVQVERPRTATSGGQSGRVGDSGGKEEVEVVVEEEEVVVVEGLWDFVRAAQEARDVQVRHLERWS